MAISATSGSSTVSVGVTSPKLRATISVELIQASVSSSRVTTAVNYELSHATGIWTDPDSNNRMVYDEVPLADVRVNVVVKNVSDTTTISESKAVTFGKEATDSFTFADTFTKTVRYNRSFTDAFTLDDLSQIDKNFYGNKGNLFAFTDIVGLTHNKTLTDSYSVGDVVSLVVSYSRLFSDNYSLGDTQALEVGKVENDGLSPSEEHFKLFGKGVSDPANITDFSALELSVSKPDSFNFADVSNVHATKVVTDAFGLDDAAQVNKDYFGNKGNNLGFADTTEVVTAFNRTFTDTYNLAEVLGIHFSTSVHDSVYMYDDPVYNAAINTNALNTLAINGNANAYTGPGAVGVGFSSPETETLSFSEIAYRGYGKGVNDNFTFSETLGFDISKDVEDAFTLDDAALVDKDYTGNKGNLLGVSDVFSRAVDYQRSAPESISFDDTNKVDTSKGVVDVNTLTDVISKTLSYARTFSDSTTFSEVPAVGTSKALSNTTSIDDILALQSNKSISDNYSFTDSSYAHIEKTINDGFSLDDAALVNKNFYGTKGNVLGVSDTVIISHIRSNALNARTLNTMTLN